jgi:hypothetical protein
VVVVVDDKVVVVDGLMGIVNGSIAADRVLAQDKLRTHPYALIGHPTVGPATPNTPRMRKNISEHRFAPPKQLRVL